MSRAEIAAYLATIGRKGGQAKGSAKVRGDAAYYRALAAKSAKARRAKALTRATSHPRPRLAPRRS